MTFLEGNFWQLPSEKVGLLLCEENNILFFKNRSSLQKILFSDKHFHFGDSGFATSSNKTLEFKGNSGFFKVYFKFYVCVCVCVGLYTLNCIYMHNNLFSYCSEKEAFKNGRVKT